MKTARSATGLLGLAMLLSMASALAQLPPEVRRARPADEPPVARALPLEEPTARPPRPPRKILPNHQRENPKRLTAASSIMRTRFSLANFTIWRSRNIKNISMIIRACPAGRTLIFRWANAIEISIASRVLAQTSKKC